MYFHLKKKNLCTNGSWWRSEGVVLVVISRISNIVEIFPCKQVFFHITLEVVDTIYKSDFYPTVYEKLKTKNMKCRTIIRNLITDRGKY